MRQLPTGTVTFLFTDIEGSTTLLQRLGDRRYAEVLAEHQRLLRDAFVEGHGQEVDTQGDAFLVAFPRARDAVGAAVAAQRTLTGHAWPDSASLRVRMGLHTGEPISDKTGYVGIDVHRAARIAAVGHGGQILLSETVALLAGGDLPPGVSLRDLGSHRLKDLREPEHLFQVMHPDLPTDFPPLKSVDVLPNNLPRQLTSFIRRDREMAEIKQLLSATCLLTLTGAGGSGKTRLALQVGADLLELYADGVWFVDLAGLAEPVLVPQAVASALSVHEQPGRALTETLVDSLRPKSLLLLLDNCEHLLATCAHLNDALLRACPNLRILATSREALGIAGETLYLVPTLPVPNPERLPPLQNLVQYGAVQLFTERARAVLPTFRVTPQNAKPVVQICYQLDGIPLAIELAAVRVKMLAVEQIVLRLDDRFRLLRGGGRTALPRQQTLRATMDWSYDLLLKRERTLLGRVSVFAGGWTLEAVEAVCSGNGVESPDILDLLTQLVDKSLVVVEMKEGETRYRLLETVRQYGRDRLLELKESEGIQGRHLDYFLRLAEEVEPKLEGAEQAIWLDRLGAEHDNLREALAWSMQGAPERGVRLAGALGRFWLIRGHFTEGRGWLKEALGRGTGESGALRAKAFNWAGSMAVRQVDYTAARLFHGKSLAIYRELGDKRGIADSLGALGALSMNAADHASACAFFEESLTIYRQLGNKRGIVNTLNSLGHETWHQGDHASARRFLEEAVVLAREYGQRRLDVFALYSLGLVACDQHNYMEAHALYEEGLGRAKELGEVWIGTFLVEAFAALIAGEGQYVQAARLLGAAEAHRIAKGTPLPFAHRSDYDRPVATIRAGLKEEAFAAAWAEGRAMTLEQAIDYALSEAQGTGRESAPR